ncbi:hypothetical protein ECFRIK1997_4554, partial [Escherichia coli FRIK1997]
GTSLG